MPGPAEWGLALPDAGPSGRDGFSDLADGKVQQRFHSTWGHSHFFFSLNYEQRWIQFLNGKPVSNVDFKRIRHFPLLWLGSLLLLLVTTYFGLRYVYNRSLGSVVRRGSVPEAKPNPTVSLAPQPPIQSPPNIPKTDLMGPEASKVNLDLFYACAAGEEMGSWYEIVGYGYCFQPKGAAEVPGWRPYKDGYWTYTEGGWTWVSFEKFGWAMYHYGRWLRLDTGWWFWVPGNEWAPAWVSWRVGGGYLGWAPLPPELVDVARESKAITRTVDVDLDIGPGYYNFVDVHHVGEAALNLYIVDMSENIKCINQTVNVTNIIYKNQRFYTYGPDINVMSRHPTSAIGRPRLKRLENIEITAAKSNVTQTLEDNVLTLPGPQTIGKSVNENAPAIVKLRLSHPLFDRGWAIVGDEKVESDLREHIKKQNSSGSAPPTP